MDLYHFGDRVVPASQRRMELRFATATEAAWPGAEGKEVVVKVRRKSGGFSSKRGEQAWRASNECSLGLRASANIVRIHDVLEDEHAYYVVMERAPGKDLGLTLFVERRLPAEEAKEVLRQLLQGVAELHAAGCIHKDIKLENVMLDRSKAASSADDGTLSCPTAPLFQEAKKDGFKASRRKSRASSSSGLRLAARAGEGGPAPPGAELPPGAVRLVDFDTLQEWSPKMPKAIDVLGTDQYIAPEAYDGKYSPASDVFAVGVIAYALFTGTYPFDPSIFDDEPGENWVGSSKMQEIKARLLKEVVDWGHEAFQDVGAATVISRMLSMDEKSRPSAREILTHPWFQSPRLSSRSKSDLRSPLWTPLSQMP